MDPAPLTLSDEKAVLKTFVDWFALESSTSLLFTYGSSFGKSAAEASDAPSMEVNHTRCTQDETAGRNWSNAIFGAS